MEKHERMEKDMKVMGDREFLSFISKSIKLDNFLFTCFKQLNDMKILFFNSLQEDYVRNNLDNDYKFKEKVYNFGKKLLTYGDDLLYIANTFESLSKEVEPNISRVTTYVYKLDLFDYIADIESIDLNEYFVHLDTLKHNKEKLRNKIETNLNYCNYDKELTNRIKEDFKKYNNIVDTINKLQQSNKDIDSSMIYYKLNNEDYVIPDKYMLMDVYAYILDNIYKYNIKLRKDMNTLFPHLPFAAHDDSDMEMEIDGEVYSS